LDSIYTSHQSFGEEPDNWEEEEMKRKEYTSAEEFGFHDLRHWPQ
jgi:hypothetical protein